jgi:nucleoside-diphosphate-sugar epimerase
MNVLVMGATGFVGNLLVKALIKEGHSVTCFVRKTSNIVDLKQLKVEFAYGDILDVDSIKKAIIGNEVIYDLVGAGNISSLSEEAYLKFKKVNVFGTENLLKACLGENIKKIIYYSSTAAMGVVTGVINEKTKCNPLTPYQRSKFESEELISSYCKKYNLPVVIIRPPMVYGPGDVRSQLFKVYKLIKSNFVPLIGNGRNIIPLIYIHTLVDASVRAILGKNGETYILADEKVSLLNIIEIMKRNMSKTPIILKIPAWFARLIAFCFELLSKLFRKTPFLTRMRVNSMTSSRIFDVTKAKREIGFRQLVNLNEGMKETIKWYQSKNL